MKRQTTVGNSRHVSHEQLTIAVEAAETLHHALQEMVSQFGSSDDKGDDPYDIQTLLWASIKDARAILHQLHKIGYFCFVT